METLSERHRALNIAAGANPDSWTVGNNGHGKRNWFVLRKPNGSSGRYEYYNDKRGELIWLTEAGALSRAEQLNKTGAATE